ncbi:MAG: autotransporter domain-containing protein [Elusimicrobiota bacterium]
MRAATGARPNSRVWSFLLAALACSAAPGHATLYQVTNADPGADAGSLGAALTAAAGSPGSTDLIWIGPYLPSGTLAPTGPFLANKTGANTLSLDGNQVAINFAGANGMEVTSGVLSVNGLAASGIQVDAGGTLQTSFSSISGLTLNGGTFQAQDAGAVSGVVLAGTGGTVDSAGNNPSMSAITGTGGLTVMDSVGGGILTLNTAAGNNTYSGGTLINSGTLQLGANSALPAGSALNTAVGGTLDLNGYGQTLGAVANLGTVKTGLGVLTASSYGGGGTLSVALRGGPANLNVTGAASLAGGTLGVVGHPALGAYTIVTAGTLSGAFSATQLPYGVTDALIYNYAAGTMSIDILSDTPFTFKGQTANQGSVANAFNLASYSATGDLGGVIAAMTAMTRAQTETALDQIGPVAYAALTGISRAAAGVQSAAVTQRLTGLQAGAAGPDGGRFASFNVRGQAAYPGTLVAELPGDASAAYSGDYDRRFDPNSRWGFFLSGLGTFDHLDGINGNAGFQPGYEVTATGETLGGDYRFNDHFAAGLAGGYVNGFTVIGPIGSASIGAGTVYGQSARLGAYATAYGEAAHANLYVGGAHDFYDTSRNIAMLARTATASPSGLEFNTDAAFGWDFKTAHAVVSPFVDLAYDRLRLGSFTESGAGALDLGLAQQTPQSLRSTLGTKFSRRFKPGWCDVVPYASLGWQQELLNQSRVIESSLASGGSETFGVRTADVSRYGALLGAGLDMDWTDGFSTRLAYQSELRTDYNANTFSGSLRWRF